MTAEAYIKAQLAAAAHRNAGHQGGVDPLLAVAFVLRNRQRAGWHGGDWMQILGHQDDTAAWIYPPSDPDLRQMNFRMFLGQIDDVFSGQAPDRLTEGALYYAELHRVERGWFRVNILGNPQDHARVAQVGTMVFFR